MAHFKSKKILSLWEYMVFYVINIAINHSSLKCLMFGKWAKDSTLISLIRCLLRIMEKIETLLVVMVVSEFLTCMFLETGTKVHKPEKKWHRERGFWFGPRINGKSGEITSSNFKIFHCNWLPLPFIIFMPCRNVISYLCNQAAYFQFPMITRTHNQNNRVAG